MSWTPKSEYSHKSRWLDHEDKALMLVWGLTTVEEICEAFMCYPHNIIDRARQLGIMPAESRLITAENIEDMVVMMEYNAMNFTELAELFRLPDDQNRFIPVPTSALNEISRERQDYYAKTNDNQLDLLNNAEDN